MKFKILRTSLAAGVCLGVLLVWAALLTDTARAEKRGLAAAGRNALSAATPDAAGPSSDSAESETAKDRGGALTSPLVVIASVGGIVLLIGVIILIARLVGAAPEFWEELKGRRGRSSRRSIPPAALVAFGPDAKPIKQSAPAPKHRAA
jgi:hypothetical protein